MNAAGTRFSGESEDENGRWAGVQGLASFDSSA